MDISNKSDIYTDIDALPVTDEHAKSVGFENAAHYKAAFKKLIDLIDACAHSNGRAELKGLLSMAANLMKAVFFQQTKGMNDEQRAEAGMDFFKLAMAIVMEGIGGELLDVQIPDQNKKPDPVPERGGNNTLH